MSNELTTPSALGILTPQEDTASGSVTASEQTRAMQEVQASILMAMRYPRDEDECLKNMLEECKRPRLAEVAQYVYAKGGTEITGPSIRLMEACKRNWKHVDSGWRVIQETPKGATVMAYAWDMQTNNRERIEFYVEYVRATKKGSYRITDPREKYEHCANNSSRRIRACLQKVIPAWIVDEAIEQCNKTLNASSNIDIVKLSKAFDEYGVTKEMIEARVTHSMESITQQEAVNLRKVYTSIRDGFKPASFYFEMPEEKEEPKKTVGLTPKKSAKKETEPAPTELPPEEKPEEDLSDESKPPEESPETIKAQKSLGLGDLT